MKTNKLWTQNFRLVILASGMGTLGTIAGSFALSFLVFDETGSTLASALIVAIQLLPHLLLPVLVAPFMDRLPRKSFLVAGDAANAVLIAGMGLWLLNFSFSYVGYLALSLMLACLGAIDELAFTSIYPELIPQGAEQKGYAVSSMLSGAIGYTSALTDHLVEKAGKTEILQKQKADPATDVILGLPFLTDDYAVSDEQKEADVTDYLEGLSVTERAAAYTAMMSVPSEEYLSVIVEQQMGSLDRASIEQMVISTYAQQMSVDEATVKSYIAQMDDETLFGYVEQSIREQVTEQYAAGVQARLANMTSDQLAMALDLALEKSPAVTPLTSEQYNWLYDNYMPATVSNGTYEDNLKLLGDVDLASPKTINIYASTFADKDAIADAIEQYNSSVSEDDQIDYTDYVALLMSSVTTIINAISYVLIAFVAISLVVSSIMIGIITYISVLERTKEIGILRAIGASKRDISRVFNAETLIEGFCSGAIGIGITLLLIIPINLVVHHLTGIESLNAILPPVGGAALVVISMALTFIAGLIPSGIAARKDPVEALRTE